MARIRSVRLFRLCRLALLPFVVHVWEEAFVEAKTFQPHEERSIL
jgi:hypothetical protein